ncbi:PQQ-dependent sugar dehydrogenase [Taibaiella soli]|uniref:PQQ-dependent sugar dehydrogenase n=1 Tax=Taibaiella soli TaxID=1649169 RepID=UPI0014033691|nr:PQQ-dependent sugar dehydrogenase [Taibaiella soli]
MLQFLSRVGFCQTTASKLSFKNTGITGLSQAVGINFAADGYAYIWEKAGKVKSVAPNSTGTTTLLDLSDEVYHPSGEDHGLLGFALDPDFSTNGYVYLWYTVEGRVLFNDPGIALDQSGPTQGRCTRYTVQNHQINPNTRLVLLGDALGDGPPILSSTHGVGTCFFDQSGYLMLSVGDGSFGDSWGSLAVSKGMMSQAMLNLHSERAQVDSCLAGKILRIDPATGGQSAF